MTSDFDDLADDARAQRRRTASSHADRLLTDPAGQRSDGVLPQPGDRGHFAAHAPLRHPRLRDVGAHGLRVGRPGARHGAEADPPRRRRLRARRRLRFDDQPDRHLRLLPALRAVARQRRRRSARAARSTRRATASCWAKARASSCSRNGKRRAARGARIYAELAGDGNSLSSYRITDSPPDGDGPIQAMRAALADAGAAPADVDYLNAHGTSTGMNDRSESAATRAVFGADVDARQRELDQEHDGAPDRRRRRGRGRRLRARDPSRRDADQREPASSAIPTATSTSSPARRAGSAFASRCPTRSASAARTAASSLRHPDEVDGVAGA